MYGETVSVFSRSAGGRRFRRLLKRAAPATFCEIIIKKSLVKKASFHPKNGFLLHGELTGCLRLSAHRFCAGIYDSTRSILRAFP